MWLRMVDRVCLFFASEEKTQKSKASHKKVTFDLSGDDESEGEDMEDIFGGKTPSSEKSESKSSFEKRQEKVIRFKVFCTFLLFYKHFIQEIHHQRGGEDEYSLIWHLMANISYSVLDIFLVNFYNQPYLPPGDLLWENNLGPDLFPSLLMIMGWN